MRGLANELTYNVRCQNDIKLGTEKSGWKGFNIPVIEIGKGTYINPATMNLKTLSHLVDDLVSPYASPPL